MNYKWSPMCAHWAGPHHLLAVAAAADACPTLLNYELLKNHN